MRGGYLHSSIIANELRDVLERLGGRVWTEYPAGPGRRAGAVDLYVELHGRRLACEVEMTPRRVAGDVRKAMDLGVEELLIVTPTAREAASIRLRLRTLPRSGIPVRVLPFGRVINWTVRSSPRGLGTAAHPRAAGFFDLQSGQFGGQVDPPFDEPAKLRIVA